MTPSWRRASTQLPPLPVDLLEMIQPVSLLISAPPELLTVGDWWATVSVAGVSPRARFEAPISA
ncbi:hypothetical protein GCM10020358_59450 [Amorphoplanes nipponensis]|uniref:Uncharacterized protein n=1 Tax=Actinoplanes nipponensis TaxID=135950 RepID=A0A919MM07_9ACTN|nr:hypothetical protein Ani05nite_04570 [Actinoplanes nipponensis]